MFSFLSLRLCAPAVQFTDYETDELSDIPEEGEESDLSDMVSYDRLSDRTQLTFLVRQVVSVCRCFMSSRKRRSTLTSPGSWGDPKPPPQWVFVSRGSTQFRLGLFEVLKYMDYLIWSSLLR